MIEKKKHSFEFKLSCAEQITEGLRSSKSLAKEFSVTESMVRRWAKQFREFGKVGLAPRIGKRTFSASFKAMVLQTVQQENLSLDEALLRFNLSAPSQVISWRKRFEEQGHQGLVPQLKGRRTMDKPSFKRKKRKSDKPLTREEELLLENEYLRAENALLKKLHALAQEDNKRKR
jgi:transposase